MPSFIVPNKTPISIQLTCPEYDDYTDTIICTEDTVLNINMHTAYRTFTINPTPADATVVLIAGNYTQNGNSITVLKGTKITYTVSKTGYETVTSTYTIYQNDYTLNVTLREILARFDYTGAQQSFTVPAGVTQLYVDMYGAAGGSLSSDYTGTVRSGYGGRTYGTMFVTPGEVLYLYVGGKGPTPAKSGGAKVNGGWNGGATGYSYAPSSAIIHIRPGGGGATDIRIGGTALSNRVLVAGGGGGLRIQYKFADGSYSYAYSGGDGGGTSGSRGSCAAAFTTNGGHGCLGGTQSAGGEAAFQIYSTGSTSKYGYDGTLGNGGAYGGGGGYYGGGGCWEGIYAAAAGGSGYVSSDTTRIKSGTTTSSTNNGNGYIILYKI